MNRETHHVPATPTVIPTPTGDPEPPDALTVHDVHMTYGEGPTAARALRGLDLTFGRGTFTAVMGPSGSGKSTFLHCAAGLEPPTSGRVIVGGQDLTGWSESQRTVFRRQHIGLVFQQFHLLPYLTAAQNAELPARLAGRRLPRHVKSELLDRVGLGDRADHLPAQLSGGQRQRVAVARALALQPAVVLADEPTGALDSTNARTVLELLRHCVDGFRQTVVMVTHDAVAASYADSVVFLVDGLATARMSRPSAEAIATQMAHLDELVAS